MIPKEYKKGKFGAVVEAICDKYKLDKMEVRAFLFTNFPDFNKKEWCTNCGASMAIDQYSPDILDALLLIEMGRAVKERKKTLSFTEANLIHVPTLSTTDAIRHRTTRCSYLNYIKQPEGSKNSGNWLITDWGWKALRGEPVPKNVRYFRGQLVDRGNETITLPQMFKVHVDKVREAIARRKKPVSDHTAEVQRYNPREWYEGGGYQEQGLF